MAKWDVKMSCGHVEEVNMIGKIADRERREEYLGKHGLCKACANAQQAKNNQQAADDNKEKGLVVLVGSEKQIAWAESLRRETMTKLQQGLAGNWDAMESMAIDIVNEQDSAKWWIDNRGTDAVKAIALKMRNRHNQQ